MPVEEELVVGYANEFQTGYVTSNTTKSTLMQMDLHLAMFASSMATTLEDLCESHEKRAVIAGKAAAQIRLQAGLPPLVKKQAEPEVRSEPWHMPPSSACWRDVMNI
jgi:hypothetical protein